MKNKRKRAPDTPTPTPIRKAAENKATSIPRNIIISNAAMISTNADNISLLSSAFAKTNFCDSRATKNPPSISR